MTKMSSEEDVGEEIVVSGISGRFPNSNNMHEFEHNLYNKVDMADEDESRWKHFHPEVPKRSGKIRNLEKFDASFFSILNKHANQMDPQCRILLEHSYEAILDAGISPESLIGSRTGVFIGCCFSDSRDTFLYRIPAKEGWGIFGYATFSWTLSQALYFNFQFYSKKKCQLLPFKSNFIRTWFVRTFIHRRHCLL